MKFAELNESIEFEQYEIIGEYLSEIWEDEKNELRRKSMKAINIIWDVDFKEDLEQLPNKIELPFGMVDEDEISDYISNETGFCHKGFELIVGLCTFPDDDKDYCKYFEVHERWLIDVLESLDNMNERKGVDLEDFLNNYIWDETWFIYELAKNKGELIMEKEEA